MNCRACVHSSWEWLSTSRRRPNCFFKPASISALRRYSDFHGQRGLEDAIEAVSLPVLYRYIWKALLPPLIAGVSALSLLVLSVGTGPQILALLERMGLSLHSLLTAAELAVLRIPSCIGLSLPIASLLAATFAIGGMGANQEITALNACGVTTFSAILPVILTYITITAVHFMISEGLVPYANQRIAIATDKTFLSASINRPLAKQLNSKTSIWSDQPVIFPQYRKSSLQLLFYGSGFDGKCVSDVVILETKDLNTKEWSFSRSELPCHPALKLERITVAKSAHWDVKKMMWVLENGMEVALEHPLEKLIKDKASCRNGDYFQALHFETFFRSKSKYSIQKISRFNNKFLASLSCTLHDILQIGHGKRFEEMTIYEASKMVKLLSLSWNVKESRRLKVKIHQRIALPFACIIFGTIGALTSFHLPSEQRKRGFAISLVIVFCYYIISVTGALLGQLGLLSPYLGAWMPNLGGILVLSAFLTLAALQNSNVETRKQVLSLSLC